MIHCRAVVVGLHLVDLDGSEESEDDQRPERQHRDDEFVQHAEFAREVGERGLGDRAVDDGEDEHVGDAHEELGDDVKKVVEARDDGGFLVEGVVDNIEDVESFRLLVFCF